MEVPTGRTKVENRTSESCSVDFSELLKGSSEEWTHQDTLSERKKKKSNYIYLILVEEALNLFL